MKIVLDFLKENYRLIIEICTLIFSIVFFLLKKKPVKVVDGVRSEIFKLLPFAINYVEKHFVGLKGQDKLNKCVELVCDYFKNYQDFGNYIPFVIEQIELILSTPTKKGE